VAERQRARHGKVGPINGEFKWMRNGESIWHCSDSAWTFFLSSFLGGFVVINVFLSLFVCLCEREGMVGVMDLSWMNGADYLMMDGWLIW